MNDISDFREHNEGLRRFKRQIGQAAASCGIAFRTLDGRLVFTPKGAFSDILLELEHSLDDGFIRLRRHRTTELTVKYKGRVVSVDWVKGFLKATFERDRKRLRGGISAARQAGGRRISSARSVGGSRGDAYDSDGSYENYSGMRDEMFEAIGENEGWDEGYDY